MNPIDIQDKLTEMRKIQKKVPFGLTIISEIIDQFLPLQELPNDSLIGKEHEPMIKHCLRAFQFFSTWNRNSNFEWIKEYSHIRIRLIDLLLLQSRKQFHRESHSSLSEGVIIYNPWFNELLSAIRKHVFRRRSTTQEQAIVNWQNQFCIDLVDKLAQELSHDIGQAETLHQCRVCLLELCKRTSLAPTSFLVKACDVERSKRDSVETGASASVQHGYFSGMEVASKCFKLYSKTVTRTRKRFIKEALLSYLAPHPNILPFHGVIMDGYHLSIITPWMENGDIVNYCKANPDASKKDLIEAVADALHYLKQNNIVHGDLKGSNVLITDQGNPCVGDFGVSTMLENDAATPASANSKPMTQPERRRLHTQCRQALEIAGYSTSFSLTLSSKLSSNSAAGTKGYMAPERHLPEEFQLTSAAATFESDVFSFGFLVYEVYTGEPPFKRRGVHDMVELKIIKGQRPLRPPYMKSEIWELAKECWKQQPGDRPDISDVYNVLACLPSYL